MRASFYTLTQHNHFNVLIFYGDITKAGDLFILFEAIIIAHEIRILINKIINFSEQLKTT